MNSIDKRKLELVRLEGIVNLISKNIPDGKIADLCKSELKIEYKNIDDLRRISKGNLIKIIDKSGLELKKEIDDTYEQFRYGLKPSITIFSFELNDDMSIDDKATLEINIKKKIQDISYKEDAKFKNIRLKNVEKIIDDTYEISLDYLQRYTYINENEMPDSIYELKDCFVWLGTEKRFVAIQSCPSDVQKRLEIIFSSIVEKPLHNIRITTELIEKIFKGCKKKSTLVKPDAKENECNKIVVSGTDLSKVDLYHDFEKNSRTNNMFLDELIDNDVISTLGINCNKGKIYLTKNLTATQFRKWSINRITDIMNYINNNDNCINRDIFESKNILSNTNYTGKKGKILEDICYGIFKCLKEPESSIELNTDALTILNVFQNKFYYRLYGYCDKCESETLLYCYDCNSYNLIKKRDKIYCLNCENEIEKFCCDEGHYIGNVELSQTINVFPKLDLLDEINEILFGNFKVRIDGSFIIQNKILMIQKSSDSGLIKYEDIEEFKEIIKINNLDYSSLIEQFKNIKEKCRKSNNTNCAYCNDKQDKCLMKMFNIFDGNRPSPHQGHEFGDVNFKITYKNGEQYNLVGIIKSAPSSGVLNLSSSPSREMIQQILTMCSDKRVGIIAAICPARFDDQLKQNLNYLANVTHTKIIILDDIFMCKLLVYESNNI